MMNSRRKGEGPAPGALGMLALGASDANMFKRALTFRRRHACAQAATPAKIALRCTGGQRMTAGTMAPSNGGDALVDALHVLLRNGCDATGTKRDPKGLQGQSLATTTTADTTNAREKSDGRHEHRHKYTHKDGPGWLRWAG
eukprot:5211201-Pleurochrysis_carterae.AAC.2